MHELGADQRHSWIDQFYLLSIVDLVVMSLSFVKFQGRWLLRYFGLSKINYAIMKAEIQIEKSKLQIFIKQCELW